MVDTGRNAAYSELLVSATGAIARAGAPTAAKEFGIDEVLASAEAGPDEDLAVFAFLEAQGFHVGVSAVLARFALADLVRAGLTEIAKALYGEPVSDSERVLVTGWTPGLAVAVDRPGEGLVLSDQPIAPSTGASRDDGDDYVDRLALGPDRGAVVVPEPTMATFRSDVRTRLRLGAVAETLGCCTRLLDDAVAYARTRRQFDSALGDMSAIQDMLAWAATERHQLRALFDAVIALPVHDPERDMAAAAAKALAGTVARRVVQHTLQVTGGIGFTWEYPHHRLHRRTLVLDSIGGSTAALSAELGRAVRLDGVLPDLLAL